MTKPARSTWLLITTVVVSTFPEWVDLLISWLTGQPRFFGWPNDSLGGVATHLLWPALVALGGLTLGLRAHRQEHAQAAASPLAVELVSHSDLEILFWIDHVKLVVHNTSTQPLENVRVEIRRIEAHPPAPHDFDRVHKALATDECCDGVLLEQSSAPFDLLTIKTCGGCRQMLFHGWKDIVTFEDGPAAVKAAQRYSLALRVSAADVPPLDIVIDLQLKPHPTLEDDAHSMPFPHGFQIALRPPASGARALPPRFHPAAIRAT